MRIRRSNTLADDEGTVFVTCVPNSPIQVMGRRDPRTGELCVGEVYVLNNCEPPTASDGHPLVLSATFPAPARVLKLRQPVGYRLVLSL